MAENNRFKGVVVFFDATDLEYDPTVEGRSGLGPRSLRQKTTSQITAGGWGYAPTMQFQVIGTQITSQVNLDGTVGLL